MPNPASTGLPHPASYDTSTSGIVKDNVTGLMWQQTPDPLGSSLRDAANYCARATLGGFTDWRVPSRIELWSIQDFTHYGPALDPAFGQYGYPWSSTPGHGSVTLGSTGFEQGYQSIDPDTGEEADGEGTAVRCVRGSTAQPNPHYTVTDSTVHDNGTSLTWQRGTSPLSMLPTDAATYCSGLTLAGGGWRLPSVKELESIVDPTRIAPVLDPSVFDIAAEPDGSVNQRIFHTSSIWYGIPNSGETWYVDFDLGWNGTASNNIPGILGGNPLENFHSARCVK